MTDHPLSPAALGRVELICEQLDGLEVQAQRLRTALGQQDTHQINHALTVIITEAASLIREANLSRTWVEGSAQIQQHRPGATPVTGTAYSQRPLPAQPAGEPGGCGSSCRPHAAGPAAGGLEHQRQHGSWTRPQAQAQAQAQAHARGQA